jgi:hypothetical protein
MARHPNPPQGRGLPPVTPAYLADLNSRWTEMRADIVAAALRAANQKAA